jgi:uncharacterized protein YbjT (DUF2867 family)
MTPKYLIIGGTGKTGRKVVERLENLGESVRVGSRNANPPFDWENAKTWESALEGIEKVYITFQPDLAVPGAAKAIETLTKLAKNKGVKKLILLSGKGEREAQRCEQIVVNSGLDFNIIRASWFNQNFSESFFLDPILSGHVALPKYQAKVPYVDTNDIADVVTEMLLHDTHNNNTFELTGPRTLTYPQVIAEIAKTTKRDIQFTPITLEAYTNMLKDMNVPEDFIWLIGYLFEEVMEAEGNNVTTNDVQNILGRPPKDFSEYVQETAITGVWNPVTVN